MKAMIGVDEAGRGPLAGPVAIGMVMVPEGFDVRAAFPGVNDSKQVSEKERERIYKLLCDRARIDAVAEKCGIPAEVRFKVRFASAKVIDRLGIVHAIRSELGRGLAVLSPSPKGVRVLLDGSLAAPPAYEQETIIRGDESVPLISLASIAAKVARDRLMRNLARTYPEYGFAEHKGYGTAHHYAMLAAHGPCEIHRRSFLHLDNLPKEE